MHYRQFSDQTDPSNVILSIFQVAMAKVMEQGPVLVLTFMVQQIMILRDAVGNVIEGGEVSHRK